MIENQVWILILQHWQYKQGTPECLIKVAVMALLVILSYTSQLEKRTFLDLLIDILSNYSSEGKKKSFWKIIEM